MLSRVRLKFPSCKLAATLIPHISFNKFIYRLLSENKLLEIHNKMFFGLHNLKILSLNNNHITCVMPGSFDHLASLHTLYLIFKRKRTQITNLYNF